MPLKPGGRQPPSAHVIHTGNCSGRRFSRPVSETITSAEKLLPQAAQIATSALLSLARSLGIYVLTPRPRKCGQYGQWPNAAPIATPITSTIPRIISNTTRLAIRFAITIVDALTGVSI